ncbi:MAG: hypothetical protein WCD89_10565 [Anaerocolumna sp.]
MKILCNQEEAEALRENCEFEECEDCILYQFCKEEFERGDIDNLIKEND